MLGILRFFARALAYVLGGFGLFLSCCSFSLLDKIRKKRLLGEIAEAYFGE